LKAQVSILELKSHNSRFSSRTIKPTPKEEWRNGAAYVTSIEADDEVRVVRVRRNRCGETQHVAMRPLIFPFESCESWEEDAPEVTLLPLEDMPVGQVNKKPPDLGPLGNSIREFGVLAEKTKGEISPWICPHCFKACESAAGKAAHIRAKHPKEDS